MTDLHENNLQQTPLGCFAHFFWVMLGNFALAICAILVFRNNEDFSISDILYWSFVVSMIAVRYFDITKLNGTDGMGERKATLGDWRRYSLKLLLISSLVWIATHAPMFIMWLQKSNSNAIGL